MRIRKTRYLMSGQSITLAYVAGIAAHPEVTDDTPPPAPEPRTQERSPQWSERNIRRERSTRSALSGC